MTDIEICNRALHLLGHDREITSLFETGEDGAYTDASTEAVRCRQFYGAAVKDCLAAHDWDFAAEEKVLSPVTPDAFGWVVVAMPEEALRLIVVRDGEGNPYKTERNSRRLRVRTFGRGCVMRYVRNEVEAEEMPHKFCEAVIAQLAFLLAGPMFGDDSKTNNFYQLAQNRISDAITKETDETAYRGEWDNPFIRSRR